jgi:effector-binding domain-containing protein
MKWIKRILLTLIAIIALALIVAFLLPSSYKVERSVIIVSDATKIMSQVTDLKKWDFWSPWKPHDTAATYTYNDTVGKNAFMSWKGKIVGTGNLRITAVDTGKSISYNLAFVEPYENKSTGSYIFEKAPEGTKVTWTNEGKLSWPVGRWMGVFMNFDKMLGPDFEKGLSLLKSHVEKMHVYSYNVVEKNIEPFTIASIHEKIKNSEIKKTLTADYAAIMEYAAKKGTKCSGPPMAMTISYDSLNWDFEAALPLDKEIPSTDKIKIKKSYGGKTAFVVYHGPYDKTAGAYSDIKAYITENNLKINGEPCETYVTDPGLERDSSKWITNIYFPVK